MLAVVWLFCLFSFRSFVAAFMFLFACVLANFGAFIYMNVRGIGLTIDTIPVISLGIGLGVDYGIYTVSRIRDEVMGGMEVDDAIVLALKTTGVAVFNTFLVMIGGIFPWIFSPLAVPQRDEHPAHLPDGHEHDRRLFYSAVLPVMGPSEVRLWRQVDDQGSRAQGGGLLN